MNIAFFPQRSRPLLLVPVLGLFFAGCCTYSLDVKVDDNSAVGLARRVRGESIPVLEPGTSEGRAVFFDDGSTEVVAERLADGTIRLSCASCYSRTLTYLFPSGSLASLQTADSSAEFYPPKSDIAVYVYSNYVLGLHSYVSYGYNQTTTTTESSYLSPVVYVPVENISSVSETRQMNRAWGWLLLPGGLMTLGGGLGLIADGGPYFALLLLTGVGLDVLGGYQAFAPNTETVLYHAQSKE